MIISAVIFDLDGTLVDSTREWDRAFVEVIKNLGVNISDEHPVEHGASMESNWRRILTKYNINTDKTFDELKTLAHRSFIKLIPEISARQGADNFLKDLKDSGVKIGLATSGAWGIVEEILNNTGLAGFFDAIVTGEETPNKKPFPDAFLIASDKLGEVPENCLVIGDTIFDIEAGRGAGMKVIAIARDEKHARELAKADLVVEDFSEITPEAIDRL